MRNFFWRNTYYSFAMTAHRQIWWWWTQREWSGWLMKWNCTSYKNVLIRRNNDSFKKTETKDKFNKRCRAWSESVAKDFKKAVLTVSAYVKKELARVLHMIMCTREQGMINRRKIKSVQNRQSEEWHRTKGLEINCYGADAEHKVQEWHSVPLSQLHWQMEEYK